MTDRKMHDIAAECVCSACGHGLTVPWRDGALRLWIHAASVGETVIAFATASQIKETWPDARVFVSTMTSTGLARVRAMNEEAGDAMVDSSFLVPFDSPPVTRAFVRAIRPTTLMLVETEIWPSLIRTVALEPVEVVGPLPGVRDQRVPIAVQHDPVALFHREGNSSAWPPCRLRQTAAVWA